MTGWREFMSCSAWDDVGPLGDVESPMVACLLSEDLSCLVLTIGWDDSSPLVVFNWLVPERPSPAPFVAPSLMLVLSAAPFLELTTVLGGLAELKYRPPPGLEEKKEE